MFQPGRTALLICWTACSFCVCESVVGQEQPAESLLEGATDSREGTTSTAAPDQVDIAPEAEDVDIAARLQRILAATGWFHEPRVRVEEGVVFLTGTAQDESVKEWAGNLARRTQDVVAVANQLELSRPSLWNLQPAADGLRELWRDTIAMLPFIAFGLMILVIAWFAARWSAVGSRRFLQHRVASLLLRNVLARAIGFVVLLLGVYIVLRVSGLTRLALTMLGGTGILGLVIGIAFRDITENFLASILLSVRRPFLSGDLVEIVNVLGFVQRLTTRSTVLMTLSGNYVEIPNATVYKNTIRNFTTNKNRREDFTIGIGYDASIADAQQIALQVLDQHPAVLEDPEPWALVDCLGSSSVVLRVYFWLDGSRHSWLKVKSSVIRQLKRAYQEAGIPIPDEAREIIFPNRVPVELLQSSDEPSAFHEKRRRDSNALSTAGSASEPTVSSAEGGLNSEAGEIEDQARQARPLEGEDLLRDRTAVPPSQRG